MNHNSHKFVPRVASRRKGEASSLCDIEDWDEPAFQSLAGEILTGDPACVFRHRKLWEFVRAVQAFRSAKVWQEDSLGLSVAAGHERLLYYAANHIKKMVATDVYGEGDFSSLEARASFLMDPKAYAPYAYREEALVPLWMNALSLDFPDGIFDFCFCLSSIEHFGGVRPAKQAIKEMLRVVRPGGIVFVTTDCSLNGHTTNEIFSPEEVRHLGTFEEADWYEPLCFSVSEASTAQVLNMRRDRLDVQPHINLRSFGAVFTSVAIVLRKKGAEVRSHAERLAKLERLLPDLSASTDSRRKRMALSPLSVVDRVELKIRRFGWLLAERLAEARGELR